MEPSFKQTWFRCPKVWTKVARWSNGRIPLSIAFSSCKRTCEQYHTRPNSRKITYQRTMIYHIKLEMHSDNCCFIGNSEDNKNIVNCFKTVHRQRSVEKKTKGQKTTNLIMKACSKIMGHYKKVISPLCSIPIRPIGRDELYSAPHHTGWLERQRETIWCQVTSGVYRGVEPISFLRVEGSNRTR